MESSPEILTKQQVADLLQVSLRTVQMLVSDYGMPVHHLGPRELRFLRSEILLWLRSGEAGKEGARSGLEPLIVNG